MTCIPSDYYINTYKFRMFSIYVKFKNFFYTRFCVCYQDVTFDF